MSPLLPSSLTVGVAFLLAGVGTGAGIDPTRGHSESNASAPPHVTIDAGAIEGLRLSDGSGSSTTTAGAASPVLAFLGVPYAAPPVGDLRWRPPRPVAQWTGTRKAIAFGASCPQLPARWLPDVAWSEDCLFLNVWTTGVAPTEKRPVIVWLHGGGNKNGRGEYTPLGPPLARLGAVVVSLNYRLGPPGFMAHPALTAESPHHSSGNYGLLDQLRALRWVRDNIARFGGDPRRVTLAGHSSGGVDTCLLMASPLAAGLFHRAILHSGECQALLNTDLHATLRYNGATSSGEQGGERLARDLGITSASAPMPASGEILRQLRAAPAETLLKTAAGDPQVRLDVLVDGWLIPDQPATVFAQGRQLDIPVIVGSTANEATIFGGLDAVKTVDSYKKFIEDDLGKFAGRQLAAYPVASDADVRARLVQLYTDTFGYGAYAMARSITRAGRKAYLYCFTQADTGTRASLGAHHGADLFFLSGEFPNDWTRTKEDEALLEVMRRYWIQFARTGDPNVSGLPKWPAYNAADNRCLDLGRVVRMRPVPHAVQFGIYEGIMQEIFKEVLGPTSRTYMN
jgi:para-nitrobenzyl esterase